MSSVLAKTVAYMIFSVLLILFLNIVSYRETKKIHKNESSTKYIEERLKIYCQYTCGTKVYIFNHVCIWIIPVLCLFVFHVNGK